MTNDYRIMLPLMAATVGSVYVSHLLFPFSIYTLKLHRRGIDFPNQEDVARPAVEVTPQVPPSEPAGA